jgi:DNA-binding beta-propeller fold protein YncE
MGKWKRQPSLPPGLPSETRKVERVLEAVEQESVAEVAREETLIEQGLVPPVTYPPGTVIPVPEPVIPPVPPYECPKKPFLYVTGYQWTGEPIGSTMYIIDPEVGVVVKTLPLEQPTLRMVYDPASQGIFMDIPPASGSENVIVFDVETNEFIATIVTGEYAQISGVDPVRNVLYVPLMGNPDDVDVAIVDLNTRQVIATLSGLDNVAIAWVEPQTGTVYVLGSDNTTYSFKIWKIDPDTYQVTLVTASAPANGWFWAAADMTRGKIYLVGDSTADMPILVSVDIQTETAQILDLPEHGSIGIDEHTGNVLLIGGQTVYIVNPMTLSAELLATIDNSEYHSQFTSNSITYENILYTLTQNGTIYGFDLDTGAEVFHLALGLDVNFNQAYELVVAPRCIEWPV